MTKNELEDGRAFELPPREKAFIVSNTIHVLVRLLDTNVVLGSKESFWDVIFFITVNGFWRDLSN
jgi:hypothetical protein